MTAAQKRVDCCQLWWLLSIVLSCKTPSAMHSAWCHNLSRCRSSITKWAAHISQERFDLESPNSLRTSIPNHSTAHRIWRRQLLSVGIYRSSKTGRNADGFVSNFNGASFCKDKPIVWLLVNFSELFFVRERCSAPLMSFLFVFSMVVNCNWPSSHSDQPSSNHTTWRLFRLHS